MVLLLSLVTLRLSLSSQGNFQGRNAYTYLLGIALQTLTLLQSVTNCNFDQNKYQGL